jgi:hypothetical protein
MPDLSGQLADVFSPPTMTPFLLYAFWRVVGGNTLPGYGPVILVKRPVRICMQGVLWGLGELKPTATRLGGLKMQIAVAK